MPKLTEKDLKRIARYERDIRIRARHAARKARRVEKKAQKLSPDAYRSGPR